MIDSISNKLADYLCKNNIVEPDEKEIYVYGFQLLLSSVIGVAIVLSIGAVLGKLLTSLIFLVVFITTRQFCGGYHAKSYLSCTVVFTAVFGFVVMLERLLQSIYSFAVLAMFMIVYLASVFDLAPMENENKPMSFDEKEINRNRSVIISMFWLVVAVILFYIAKDYSLIVSLTLFFTAMLMMIENFRKDGDIIEKDSD